MLTLRGKDSVSTGNLLLTTICVCNAGKSNALGAEALGLHEPLTSNTRMH